MKPRTRKKLFYWLLALALPAAFFLLLPLITYKTIQNEVDVNSGRTRTLKYFFGIKFSETIKENDFSALVQKYGLSREPPEWHFMDSADRRIVGAAPSNSTDFGSGFYYCLFIVRTIAVKVMTEEEKKAETARLLDFLKDRETRGEQ